MLPRTRLILKIILQIWIFALFLFCNGYQGLVASFMLSPIRQDTFKSVEELLGSKIAIEEFTRMNETLGKFQNYQKVLQENRTIEEEIFQVEKNGSWIKKMIELNAASMQSCNHFKHDLKLYKHYKISQQIYLLPEVVHTIRDSLFVPNFHPLIEKFQVSRNNDSKFHQIKLKNLLLL